MQDMTFWIVWGIVIAAILLISSRERIEKQRTLQRLLERNEEIDEELVNKLLGKRPPGTAWRALRIIGTIVMLCTIPWGVISAMILIDEGSSVFSATRFALIFSMFPLVIGLGLFLSSRFCKKPDQGNGSR